MMKRIYSLVLIASILMFFQAMIFAKDDRAQALSISGNISIDVGEEFVFADKFMGYVDEDAKSKLKYEVTDESIVYHSVDKYKFIGLVFGQTKFVLQSSDLYTELIITVKEINYFPNGDMSNLRAGTTWDFSNDKKDGWTLYTGNSAVKPDQTVEILSIDGNNVVHYDHKTQAYSAIYTSIAVEPGQYYVNVDMKGNNVEKDVYVRVNQGNKMGANQTEKIKGTFDWSTFSSGVVRVEAGELLKLELYFANNTGEVFFDNIEVFRLITKDYTNFMVGKTIEELEIGQTAQIRCETFPTSVIDFNYEYQSDNKDVASVNASGVIKAKNNGIAKITIKDVQYGNVKQVMVVVGTKDGITAQATNGNNIIVKEDSVSTITLEVTGSSNYLVNNYSNPVYGKYYIKDKNIIYSPNKDIYSSSQNDTDSFKILVFDESKGYTTVTINIYIEGEDDPCSVIDYWHTAEKNTPLKWVASTDEAFKKNLHQSGNLHNGGYLEVSCYDIEALIPITKKIPADKLTQKKALYSKIVGSSKNGSLTMTTANGGQVEILNDGKATEIRDRYYASGSKIIFGVMYNYTPKEGFTGYDKFELKISNGEEVITFTNTVYVMPSMEDFKFDKLDFSGVYLLTNDDWLSEVRTGLESKDPYITTWVDYYKKQYANFTPTGVPANARSPLEQLAILYQVTGDKTYFDLCWLQLKEIVKDEAFSGDGTRRTSWGEDSNGFLDAAMVTYSIAFTYNLIKEELGQSQKEMVIKALYEEGLYYFENLENPNVLLHGNNHNLLVCGNLALAGLSVMSFDGELTVTVKGVTKTIDVQEVAAQTVKTAFKYLQVGLVHYSNSGGFPEGPAYSYYAHRNMVSLLATLRNLYKEDANGKINSFGLSDIEGIMNYTNYPLYSSTPNYDSFFYAESEYSNNQPALLWYTRIDESNTNAAVLSKIANGNQQYNIMNLLWYRPGLFESVDLQNMKELDMLLQDHELATFRESFGDEFAVFTGLKGTDNNSGAYTHKNLDSGTFELYALGERFIGNFSNETYNTVVPNGFWDYDYQRWTYYKKNTQGQNTLVFNPEDNPVLMQDPNEKAPITRFESNNSSGLSIIDLSRVYKKDALSVRRGLKIFNQKSNVMIQDEFSLRKESTVYWSAHTAARIDIISDKLASLTLNGKRIYAYINSEIGTFSKMSATALPGTIGEFCNLDNKGVNKLVIKLEGIVDGTLNVMFVPTLEEIQEIKGQDIKKLDDWTLDANIDKNSAHVDDITFDSEWGNRYKYVFNPYQYKYAVKLDSSVKEVPNLDITYDEAKYEVNVIKSQMFSDLTKVVVKDRQTGQEKVYEYKFIVDSMVDGYDDYSKIAVAKATGSSEEVNNLLDDDKSTTLSSLKKEEVVFEFGKKTIITNVLFRFAGGLLNTYYFDVYYSDDNINYKACYFAGQSTNQMGEEVISLGKVEAKYIKIVFNGNNNDDKIAISKVAFMNNNFSSDSKFPVLPVVLGSLGGVLAIGAAVAIILIKRRKKHEKNISSVSSND